MKRIWILGLLFLLLVGCNSEKVTKKEESKLTDSEKEQEIELVEGSKLLVANEKALTGDIKVLPKFKIKSLNRERNIWIYFPPSYQAFDKEYPVLYMQDGQSIFKSADTEWKVDEALKDIFKRNQAEETIVVGIESDPETRFDEYAPWKNGAGDGGEGDLYVDFIVKELKPYIDDHFRTLKDRENTLIAGASMGGYISLYAAVKYQDVFGKVAAFSPIIGFNKASYVQFINKEKKKQDMIIYLDSGEKEEEFINADEDVKEMKELLINVGFQDSQMKMVIDPNGIHRKESWQQRFPEAFVWLMNAK
ncbi:alpha/beta hydrolase [Neobacillus sp. D3-1R]|uniref:alpha/beta hydrolase n=1 Tax=Neobacillus sp. D3-1R TaxID=3445778 RepID=UPI003FA0EA12